MILLLSGLNTCRNSIQCTSYLYGSYCNHASWVVLSVRRHISVIKLSTSDFPCAIDSGLTAWGFCGGLKPDVCRIPHQVAFVLATGKLRRGVIIGFFCYVDGKFGQLKYHFTI